MRIITALSLLLGLVALLHADVEKFELPKPDADGKIAIFNGKDLSGWYGDADVWSVKDGEIVGKTEKGLKHNTFLKSKFELGDFRLTLKIKLTPDNANSGVQFRSVPWEDYEMKGYQADAGAGWWGKLYEENGRAIMVDKGAGDSVNKEDWNTYEILAVGHKIQIAFNGQKVVDLENDEKGALKGILGLQVHAGGPTEVRFKDLSIELNPKGELTTLKK